MVLSSSEAIKLIQDQVNKDLIAKAIRHEERIRFHSQLIEHKDDASSYLTEFLEKIKKILPTDKYERFVNTMDFPLPTTELVDVIFSELSKVFDAQNKHLSYQFTRNELRDDFINYLEWMEFSQFWENECFEAIRTKTNCIQVVDMASIINSPLPQPYAFNLSIERVIAIEMNADGNITFLAYWDEGRVISLDENYYRSYTIDGTDLKTIAIQFENLHFLGYAPCRFLVTDTIGRSLIVKESPISKALWSFDRLLYRIIAGENLEDYASYPIYSVYEEDCDYKDAKGNHCQGGKINCSDPNGLPYVTDCPVCKDNFYLGPGTIVTSKPPRTKDQPDLLDQVKITSADTKSLEFVNGSIEKRKAGILSSCIGGDNSEMNGQAKNEMHVLSIYDTKQAILMKLKRNIEKAKKFVIDTMAKHRYAQSYLGCTVDEGTKFYLATSQQLNEKLKMSIENGASVFEVDMIKDEIYSNEYRNNPEQHERREILKRLEPYYGLTIDQITALNAVTPIDSVYLQIKYNFAYFISKFEDENGSITEFGSLLPMSKRIETIKNQLLSYGKSEFTREPIS